MKVALVAGVTVALVTAGCSSGGASASPSSTSESATTMRGTGTSSASPSPAPAPSGIPVVKAGDALIASPSGVGPASIKVPPLSRRTKSLVFALKCDTDSFALRSRGRSPFQGECSPGLVNAVRVPLDLLNVGDLSWQVRSGVAWQSWVWSSATER